MIIYRLETNNTEKVKNITWKQGINDDQHFLLFPQCIIVLSRMINNQDGGVKGYIVIKTQAHLQKG